MCHQSVTILSMFFSEAFYVNFTCHQRRQLFLKKVYIYYYKKNFGDTFGAWHQNDPWEAKIMDDRLVRHSWLNL